LLRPVRNAYRVALMLNLIGADWKPTYVDFFKGGETRTPKVPERVNEMGEVRALSRRQEAHQSGVILNLPLRPHRQVQAERRRERLEALRWIILTTRRSTASLALSVPEELRAAAGDPAVMAF